MYWDISDEYSMSRGVAPMGRRLELEKYLFTRFLLDKQLSTFLYYLLPQIRTPLKRSFVICKGSSFESEPSVSQNARKFNRVTSRKWCKIGQ